MRKTLLYTKWLIVYWFPDSNFRVAFYKRSPADPNNTLYIHVWRLTFRIGRC